MKRMFAGCLVAVSLSLPLLLANGGGYFRGGVERTGGVTGFEPKQTEAIRILDERLTVALGAEQADVEIRYLMRNQTAQRVKVRFGFPVEESFDNDMNEDGEQSATGKSAGWKEPRYCQAYQVTAAGKPLRAKFTAEPPASGQADKRFKGIRGWMVSETDFDGGEEQTLTIRFRSGYPFHEWGVSDDGNESARIFRYRLSTGACWAGTIERGRIELKPAGIDPSELKVLKPVNRFRKEGDKWVWDFENLEPTLADDLEIEAAPEESSYMRSQGKNHGPPYVTYVERGGRWSISHDNYKASASSVLPKDGDTDYEAANLNDGEWDSAWCEGKAGPGLGEWLELRPETPKPLLAINLAPGYMKSPELFAANARPKKVRIELNDEHKFTAEIPDQCEWRRIPVSGYTKPVRVVKIVFEDVWKGKKFDDLCISGATLDVRLDKKPKITPAR